MAKKAESGGYARLKGDLAQKTPGSFYVLYGEEDYLRRYYLSMLRRQLVDGPTEDFNFHRLTSENFSMQVLSESLEALPMMAERTMIQIDDVDLFALPEDDRTQLAALFSDIPDYACLVLVYADFKPDKRIPPLFLSRALNFHTKQLYHFLPVNTRKRKRKVCEQSWKL